MKVLVGCEESQAVCIAFRKLGHEAYSCDLQECSGGHPEWHLQMDVFAATELIKPKLFIGHPPCTYLSNAGACRMYPSKGIIDNNRLALAMEAKEFFMRLLQLDIQMICLENPLPLSIVKLPKATQEIQPYQFGHPYSKRTLLWLKGLPKLKHTKVLSEFKPYIRSNTSKNKGKFKGVKFANSAKERSKTFTGIAYAMATQWGCLDNYIEPVKYTQGNLF